MLVVSRKPGESIIIGGNVRVTIVEARSDGRVRIAIEAPNDVRIDREEVHAAKAANGGVTF